MRTLATAVTAAVGLVGCTGGNPAAEGRPPIQQVAIADLPDQPAHNPSRPVHQRLGPVDRSDPEAVALAVIIVGLAREGLQVVDVGAQPVSASADQATVRVAATHQTASAASGPHTSVYQLDLTRGPDRWWRVVDFRQAQ